MRHVKSLDGLRGLAIVAVVLFHRTFLSCGWAGVQLFFVLSGFLITSILLSEADLPLGLYLKRFYWRRAIRVFPLYYGYLAVFAAVYAATGEPAAFGKFWVSLCTYTVNFQRMLPGFENGTGFGHFWSLAVEEQFYFAWPITIYLLSPRSRKAIVLVLLVLAPAARAITAHFASQTFANPLQAGQAVYSFTLGQLDAFAMGAGVAIFRDRLRGRSALLFAVATVLLVAAGQAATYAADGHLALDTSLGYEINLRPGAPQVWGYTLFDLWSASFVLVALERNRISRLLAWQPLRFIGKISYGMYVYHLVVQNWVNRLLGPRHGLANLAVSLGYFCALTAVCYASYRFYEARFLAMKDRWYARPARAGTALAGAA